MKAITITNGGVKLTGGVPQRTDSPDRDGRRKTIAGQILDAHNAPGADQDKLHLKFDALVSHDITYVGIIQTARASGLHEFPVPYAMTNCHNSLCAVGGTINEDDHVFGLPAVSAASMCPPINPSSTPMPARRWRDADA